MSFFNFLKPAKISDQLVGKDEKVCSCSVRIAALLQKSSRENKKSTALRETLALLKKQNSDDGTDRK